MSRLKGSFVWICDARSCGRDPCAPTSPRSSGPCPLATMAVTQRSICMLLHVASAIHERLHARTSACCYPQACNPFQCTSGVLSCAATRFCVEEPFRPARNNRERRRTHSAFMLRLSVLNILLLLKLSPFCFFYRSKKFSSLSV